MTPRLKITLKRRHLAVGLWGGENADGYRPLWAGAAWMRQRRWYLSFDWCGRSWTYDSGRGWAS